MFSINQLAIIKQTEKFVEKFMGNYDDSHNYAHVVRVKNMATIIAQSENLTNNEIFEIQLASLLHDINDHKYTNELFAQELLLEDFLKDKLENNIMKNVINIACNVSLSKEIALEYQNIYLNCKKLFCVQDADRIDSLGSVGITRYIIYGIQCNKSSISEIIKNIQMRTGVLLQHLKTDLGKKIAEQKYSIIKIFLDDYINTTSL